MFGLQGLLSLQGQAAAQELSALDDQGKELVNSACVQCHGLQLLGLEPRTEEEWEATVFEMISHGAPIFETEVTGLSRYLARAYGAREQQGIEDEDYLQEPTTDVWQEVLPEGEGKASTIAACSGCHGPEVLMSYSSDESGWQTVIQRMMALGAKVYETDLVRISRYLSSSTGKSGQSNIGARAKALSSRSPEVVSRMEGTSGSAILKEACVQCHGLQIISLQPRGKEEWKKTIFEMVSHGAQISLEEIEDLIEYLTRHYVPEVAREE